MANTVLCRRKWHSALSELNKDVVNISGMES